MKFRTTRLSNNLRLITVPRESEAVSLVVFVGTGSCFEEKHINGISHFLEHELFKGTEGYPKSLDIALAVEGAGGVNNAFTDRELTGYFITLPHQKTELAFDILSDMMLRPLFDAHDLEREKSVVLQELARYRDMPQAVAEDLWYHLLYGGQAAGRPIGGMPKTVQALDRTKLIHYIERYYVTGNMVVVAVGNLTHQKIVRFGERYFGSLPKGPRRKKPRAVEFARSENRLSIRYKDTDQTHLITGFYGCSLSDPDRYAADLLATILGEGMSSRLFVKVRDEKGLAYHVSAESDNETDTGTFRVQGGFDNEKAEEALAIILEELGRMKRESVPDSELDRAKSYHKGRISLGLESALNTAMFFGDQELLTGKIETVRERFRHLDAVTREDIKRVARKLFRSERLYLALVGPFRKKAKFQNVLSRFE